MSEQLRDEQGRFTGESGNETMNRLFRERRTVRQAPAPQPPANVVMNQILRGQPLEDEEPDEAA